MRLQRALAGLSHHNYDDWWEVSLMSVLVDLKVSGVLNVLLYVDY